MIRPCSLMDMLSARGAGYARRGGALQCAPRAPLNPAMSLYLLHVVRCSSTLAPSFVYGATLLSSNTGGLYAMVEALLCIMFQAVHGRDLGPETDSIVLATDSKYVEGIMHYRFHPKENTLLANVLLFLWAGLKETWVAKVEWQKGHRGDVGNARADVGARRGGYVRLKGALASPWGRVST